MAADVSGKVSWSKSGHLSSSSRCTWLSLSGAKPVHGKTLFSRSELVVCSSNPKPLLPLLPVLLLLLGLVVSQWNWALWMPVPPECGLSGERLSPVDVERVDGETGGITVEIVLTLDSFWLNQSEFVLPPSLLLNSLL